MSNLHNKFYTMQKLHQKETRPGLTYHLGRACLNCGEPIEDQARSTRTHCPRWIDQTGKVHDCRRKKHQLKHQPQEDLLLDFSARQREISKQIEKVLAAHGDIVSTEVLNAYNITLSENLRFSYHSNLGTSEFLGYKIITNPKSKTHQIVKYE